MPTKQSEKEKQDILFKKDKLTLTFNEKEDATIKEPSLKESTKSEELIVPSKLWKNVLPVLSNYPIELVQDSFIMTEWFSDTDNKSRQLKINALKMNTEVKITVLCRQKDEKGDWINQKNDATLADKIKNDIISANK